MGARVLQVFCMVALLALAATALPAVASGQGIEHAVITLVNAERQLRGLAAVRRHERLHRAAQWMAEDLAMRETLDHTDSRRRSMADRVRSFGYRDADVLAENIAEGQDSPEEVFTSWMESPGHRANLLNPDVRHVGVGHARKRPGKEVWVLDLAG
jgi:uncharacterized protein YkwD